MRATTVHAIYFRAVLKTSSFKIDHFKESLRISKATAFMSKVANGTIKAEIFDVVTAECVYVMEIFCRTPRKKLSGRAIAPKSIESRIVWIFNLYPLYSVCCQE